MGSGSIVRVIPTTPELFSNTPPVKCDTLLSLRSSYCLVFYSTTSSWRKWKQKVINRRCDSRLLVLQNSSLEFDGPKFTVQKYHKFSYTQRQETQMAHSDMQNVYLSMTYQAREEEWRWRPYECILGGCYNSPKLRAVMPERKSNSRAHRIVIRDIRARPLTHM